MFSRVSRWVIATIVAIIMVATGLSTPVSAAGSGIQGTITDAETGKPVEGAWIEAHNSSGGNSGGGNTDSSGHYDLYWLSPGEYRIKVIANEYEDQWAFGKSDQDSADPVTAPGTASLALKPIKYGSIAGRFVTRSGSSVVDAGVELYDASGNSVDRTGTDANGAFRFTRLQVGDYKLSFDSNGNVQWAHGKTTSEEADPIAVRADEETTVTEIAFPTGDLEVTIVDSRSHKPVAGAAVATRGGPRWLSGYTDAKGRVSFPGIVPGTYSFSIAPPPGYLYGSIDDVVVRVDRTTRVTGELMRESTIVATVRDARTAAPVSGACVTLFGEPAAAATTTKEAVRKRGNTTLDEECSDSKGTLRIPQLWPGRYRLFVTPTDGVHGRQWVGSKGGTGDMEKATWFTATGGNSMKTEIRLDGAGSIAGTVTDSRSGKAVEDVCAWVVPASASGPTVWDRNCTDAGGHYSIDALGPYDWRVQYPDHHGRYAWQWSGAAADRFAARPVTVRDGGTVTADARLSPGGKVTGRVVGATIPNEYVTVLAVNARTGDDAAPWAWVTGDAEYTLSGLATQRIKIAYAGGPGDLVWYPRLVNIVAGQTITGLDLVVPKE